MPTRAIVLSAQIQFDTLCLWALVDDSEKKKVRVFEVYGTGHEISNTGPRVFINTVQELDGNLVWHIFEYFGL